MVAGRDPVELTVARLVAGGSGMAELDGRKVFVPFTAPGERVRARLTVSKRDYAVAELDGIIEPSPHRREPRCRYFGRCGGCQLQHLGYEEQLRVKADIVSDALRRIGRLKTRVAPVVPSPGEWHYRNKTQYAVGLDARRRPVVGYYRAGTHHIIPAETCPLHPPAFDAARRVLANHLRGTAGEAYDERTHQGKIRHLVLRTNGARTVAVVASRSRRLDPELVQRFQEQAGIDAVARTLNPNRTNRVLGPETTPVSGEPVLEYELDINRLRVSPESFFQVNTTQARTLVRLVHDRLADRRWDVVVDLYSGVGALALAVADLADRVVGIEIDTAAVADATKNARANGRDNVEFRPGDAETLPADALPGGSGTAVILDPPRKGAGHELLAALVAARPGRVIYVSCDPATLARDLALLVASGYQLTSVEPLDMFPQTAHVETVAALERDDD